jgi:hypothetical protein
VRAKEELAKKNQEILQLHSLLTETEQLLVCIPYWYSAFGSDVTTHISAAFFFIFAIFGGNCSK